MGIFPVIHVFIAGVFMDIIGFIKLKDIPAFRAIGFIHRLSGDAE
jgi:hypothetical protein